MFRTRDPQLDDDERRREAPAQPSPPADERLAALLQLQQGAGNQAVARILGAGAQRPATLQRAEVKSSTTETGGKHHPEYRFHFPGEEDPRSHDLDQWHTGKRLQGGPAHAANLTRPEIVAVINRWDCSASIMDSISDTFAGASGWAPATGERIPKQQVTEATHTVHDELTQSEDGKVFAMHLLALKHNLARRQADIKQDLPSSMTVKKTTKVPKRAPKADVLPLTWTGLLQAARLRLKPLLAVHTPPPDWQDGVMLIHDAFFAGEAADANVEFLRTSGLVFRGGDQKASFRKQHGEANKSTGWQYSVTKITPNLDVGFGINHLSIALYYEWRAVWELMERAQIPAALVNAAVQQGPAQQGPAQNDAVVEANADPQEPALIGQ